MSEKSYAWVRPCQVCGTINSNVIYENHLTELDGKDMSYSVTTCINCGFHYANQLPEVSSYQRYYKSLSKYDISLSATAIAQIDKYRAERVVSFIQTSISKEKRILDLGCGYGILLNEFSVSGWSNLFGIDPAPNASEQAKQLFDLTCVSSGTLEGAASLSCLKQADLICMMGVLEHLPDLYNDLSLISGGVEADAKILIEVPASERFCRGDFEPFGEFSLEHIQFFSANSLNQLMAQFGFYPIKSTIVELPSGTTDSLLSLYSRVQTAVVDVSTNSSLLEYIVASDNKLSAGLINIEPFLQQPFIIYGAGSHTARLIPYLETNQLNQYIIGIVDSNANLQGKVIGNWTIRAPDELIARFPDTAILISSYRSQGPITDMLKALYPNPIITMYQS